MHNIIKRILNRWIIVTAVVGITIVSFLYVAAPSAQAIISPLNSSVFAGRFIPAFIGSAYDPSAAYEEMAGLPVYVVAFDYWNDPVGGTSPGEKSWIVSDLAIKTQIRADGSFQVQGLPENQFYGVYFPFALNPGGEGTADDPLTVRTDCVAVGSYGNPTDAGHRNTYTTGDANPCDIETKRDYWPFRMPRQKDKLVDVFSYAANYLVSEDGATPITNGVAGSGPVIIDSQVEDPNGRNGFESVRLEHIFVTNRKELDIANNINTFPLVPSSTLKVNISVNESAGAKLNVWAQRISRTLSTGHLGPVIDYPTIRGRATKVGQDDSLVPMTDYSFQAYAPEGDYSIVVWREEANSPDYKTWDGKSQLSSHLTAWAQLWVRQQNTPFSNADQADWRSALAWRDVTIIPYPNQVIVWGTVVNEDGRLMAANTVPSGSTLPDLPDAKINWISDANFTYTSAVIRDSAGGPATSPPSQDSKFVTPIGGSGTGQTGPQTAVRGIYAIAMQFANISAYQARSDQVTVSLDPSTGTQFSQSPSSPGFKHSTWGPLRNDISVKQAANGNAGGYSNGLLITAATSSEVEASGARVTVRKIGPQYYSFGTTNREFGVGADTKIYYLNRLGQVHIPLSDLRPSEATGLAPNELDFAVYVDLPQEIAFRHVVLGGPDPDFFYHLDITGDQRMESLAADKKENRYNLAILNKVTDFFNQGKTYAQNPGDPATVHVSLNVPEEGKRINGEINALVKYGDNDKICELCYFSTTGEATYDDPVGTNGKIDHTLVDPNNPTDTLTSFYVHLPVPEDMPTKRDQCSDSIATWTLITSVGAYNALYCQWLPDVAADAMNYKLQVQAEVDGLAYFAEQPITMDEHRIPSPPSVPQLDLTQNCSTLKVQLTENGYTWDKTLIGSVTDDMVNQAMGFIAETGCSAGQFMVRNIPGVLGMIYKYGLQTRALTQDQPIVNMFNIMRNLMNVLYVLIFVIIGIMTILRYQPEQWHLSILLPRIAVAFVMSNFSLLIVQAILDINNFASFAIFQLTENIITASATPAGNAVATATTAGAGVAIVGSLGASMAAMAAGLTATIAGVVGSGGLMLVPIIAMILTIIVMSLGYALMLLFIFFARYLIIWIAVITAPVVFGLGVLPWFSNLRSLWWSSITKVAFAQTAVALLLSVGLMLLTITGNNFDLVANFGPAIVGILTMMMAAKFPQKTITGVMSSLGVPAAGIMGMSAGALAGGMMGFVASRIKSAGARKETDSNIESLQKGQQEQEYHKTFALTGSEKAAEEARRNVERSHARQNAAFRLIPGARGLQEQAITGAAKERDAEDKEKEAAKKRGLDAASKELGVSPKELELLQAIQRAVSSKQLHGNTQLRLPDGTPGHRINQLPTDMKAFAAMYKEKLTGTEKAGLNRIRLDLEKGITHSTDVAAEAAKKSAEAAKKAKHDTLDGYEADDYKEG